MERSKKSSNPAADLTDDLIVEILSRLPVKSVCRFKCISRHWRDLITHLAHRKKLPQTLAGFICRHVRLNDDDDMISCPDFHSILGEEEQLVSDPSLSFLPGYRSIHPKDSCNGLLLCLCWKVSPRDKSDYVVCNPATEKWLILPESGQDSDVCTIKLGFDPAVSSHFHVFRFLEDVDGYFTGVEIYSSETGAWNHKENGWADDTMVRSDMSSLFADDTVVRSDISSVFLNGMLHLLTYDSGLVGVDREGNTWSTIPLLETMGAENFYMGNVAFIGQSQGRLYYLNSRDRDAFILSVWILENYCGGEWVFKYNISTSQLFGCKGFVLKRDYTLVAIHPECNLIFYILNSENMLLSYDMDHGEVYVIGNLKDPFWGPCDPYLPYVPSFTESLADHE